MQKERGIWGKNSPHPHLGLESEGRKCQEGSNSHSPCLYRGLNYLATHIQGGALDNCPAHKQLL